MSRLSTVKRLNRCYYLPVELLDELEAEAARRGVSVEGLADDLVLQTLPVIYAEAVSRRLFHNRCIADPSESSFGGSGTGGPS